MSDSFRLQVVIPRSLYAAIEQAAAHELASVSHVARRALYHYFQPDEATIEECNRLVDSRETYETIVVTAPDPA